MIKTVDTSHFDWDLCDRQFNTTVSGIGGAIDDTPPRYINVTNGNSAMPVSMVRTSISLNETGVTGWKYQPIDPNYTFSMNIINA